MQTTITFIFKADGVLTDVENPNLSAGVINDATGAVVVAPGTAFVKQSTGTYTYTFTDPVPGTTYRYTEQYTYRGVTYSVPRRTTASVGPEDDDGTLAPLFLPTRAELKSRLRLSNAQSDALKLLDSVLQTVRVKFYERLTASRVSAILEGAYTDSPSTDAQLTRVRAALCEENWVRMLLLRRLPAVFMATVSEAQQIWNNEGLTREIPVSNLERELNRLSAEVEAALVQLEGTNQTQDENINCSLIEPADKPDLPGASIHLRL